MKAPLDTWRKQVLTLTVTGAVLGTLSEQTRGWALTILVDNMPATGFGLLSAIALAVATYVTKTRLGGEQERRWVRARSAAEAFKAQAFLYAASGPPYDGKERGKELVRQLDKILESVGDLTAANTVNGNDPSNIPPTISSIEDYIKLRVEEQIGFYVPRAKQHQEKFESGQNWSFRLGGVAAILAAIAGVFPNGMTAGWVPVVSTVTMAVAAYFYSERHQQFAMIYQATANRLESLHTGWKVSAPDQRNALDFVRNCEEAISTENRAWMAKFVKR